MTAEQKIAELGIDLDRLAEPGGRYVHGVAHNGILYLSGKGPRHADGSRPSGQLGKDFDVQQGREFARIAGINLLAAMRRELGSLDRVERVLKVLGMVNATQDFIDHPAVIDGCSELFIEVFGDRGAHARSAVGMGIPGNAPVEIEAIVAYRPG